MESKKITAAALALSLSFAGLTQAMSDRDAHSGPNSNNTVVASGDDSGCSGNCNGSCSGGNGVAGCSGECNGNCSGGDDGGDDGTDA